MILRPSRNVYHFFRATLISGGVGTAACQDETVQIIADDCRCLHCLRSRSAVHCHAAVAVLVYSLDAFSYLLCIYLGLLRLPRRFMGRKTRRRIKAKISRQEEDEWFLLRTVTMRPDTNGSPAAHRVFTVTELLEAVLNVLPAQNLFVVQGVCRAWRDLIQRSPIIRGTMFLSSTEAPLKPNFELPAEFDDPEDRIIATFSVRNLSLSPFARLLKYQWLGNGFHTHDDDAGDEAEGENENGDDDDDDDDDEHTHDDGYEVEDDEAPTEQDDEVEEGVDEPESHDGVQKGARASHTASLEMFPDHGQNMPDINLVNGRGRFAPNASWTSTFLSQPPVTAVTVEYLDWREGGPFGFTVQNPSGLTLGDLYQASKDGRERFYMTPGKKSLGMNANMLFSIEYN